MPSSARCTNSRAGQPAAAKRGAAQCADHPDEGAPSATGRQSQKSQKMIARPKAGQNRRLHRSADPRRAEARTRRSASKRSFLLDRARPVFFSTRGKRKWGVHPAGPAPCGSRIPHGRRPAARLRYALPYFKNSSTTLSIPGFSQVRSNRRALPFRAARRRGIAVPVVSCSWSSSSTPSPAGVSPMARSTWSQNL